MILLIILLLILLLILLIILFGILFVILFGNPIVPFDSARMSESTNSITNSAWDKAQQALMLSKVLANKTQFNAVGYATYSAISFYTYSPVSGPIVDSLWISICDNAYEYFK